MEQIKSIIRSSIKVKNQILTDDKLLQTVMACVKVIVNAFEKGNKVLFCGNGGSASDAQHLAAEFSGRFYTDRDALPAEALHCNTSYITAVANDYSYDVIYSRLIKGIGNQGDVLVGLSTSGNSKNIVNAFEAAKEKKMITIAFTGSNGGKLKKNKYYLINIYYNDTFKFQ
jgi:D-sedoheptulose 7-phosphate isomerase